MTKLFRIFIRRRSALIFCLIFACASSAAGGTQRRVAARAKSKKFRRPDVIFVPTPPETVAEMLRLAIVKPTDVLYDLGSGDGRIPIRAALEHGIRAVGIDIDARMVASATEAARKAGVSELVSFRHEDLYRADIGEATIVTLYLSDSLNLKLRPKLLRELKPGTRIISHDFRMGGWKPERTVRVPWKNMSRTVYVWTVPPRRRK